MVLLAKMIIFSFTEDFSSICMYVFFNELFYTDQNPLYLLNQKLVHRAASVQHVGGHPQFHVLFRRSRDTAGPQCKARVVLLTDSLHLSFFPKLPLGRSAL